MIRISLVVPTYNRANFLLQSIPSFINQSIPSSLYELLIIDNNSDDNTKEIVNELLGTVDCQWHYFFEPRQGLHNARNTGILNARGDIIVFGDDDIIASTTWLKCILNEFDKNSLTGIVGGKILPIWDHPPDKWIYDYGTVKIHPIFAYLDYGDKRITLQKEYVFGCNFAIRKDLALKIGGSAPDTFPGSLRHLSGTGECVMIDNARKLSYQVIYLPEALVHHHAESSRATLQYFIDRYERWAIEEVFHHFRNRSKFNALVCSGKAVIGKLLAIFRYSRKKQSPHYYVIIQYKSFLQVLRQVIKVLLNKNLYNHITTENYLLSYTFQEKTS